MFDWFRLGLLLCDGFQKCLNDLSAFVLFLFSFCVAYMFCMFLAVFGWLC